MAGAWEREAVCRGKESVSASNARSWVPWGKILTFLYTFTLFTFVFMIFEEYTTAAMHRLPVKSITPLFHYVIYFVLCVYWNWINPFCCYDHDQLFFLLRNNHYTWKLSGVCSLRLTLCGLETAACLLRATAQKENLKEG